MDNLLPALRILSTPASPTQKAQAHTYLTSFLTNPPDHYLQSYTAQTDPELKLFLLNTALNHPNTNEILQIANQYAEMEKWEKNQIAYTVVRVWSEARWEGEFWEVWMKDITTDREKADRFIRISQQVHEVVVSRLVPRTEEEQKRHTLIKDNMRDTIIPELVNAWMILLQAAIQSDKPIASSVLYVIGAYSSWISLNYVVNPAFFEVLYTSLSDMELRDGACYCVAEITAKGMPPKERLELFNFINLPSVLSTVMGSTDENFMEGLANLVQGAGTSLCKSCEDAKNDSTMHEPLYAHLEALLPFLWQLLARPNFQICKNLLPFIDSLLAMFKTFKKTFQVIDSAHEKVLRTLLTCVLEKMKYTDDYDFEDPGPEEDDFIALRKDLRTISDNLIVVDSELFINVVRGTVMNVLSTLGPSTSFSDLELALHLLHLFSEATNAKNQFKIENTVTPLGEMIEQTINANVLQFSHQAVALQYLECIYRYMAYFQTRPDMLKAALPPILSDKGISHPVILVRVRASYVLLRLLTTNKNYIAPYAELILQACAPILGIETWGLRDEDDRPKSPIQDNRSFATDIRLSIAESMGCTVGVIALQQNPNAAAYLNASLLPMIQPIQEILSSGAYSTEKPNSDFERQRTHDGLMSIARFAEGFPDYSPPSSKTKPSQQSVQSVTLFSTEVVETFAATVQLLMSILDVLKAEKLVREAVRYAFQRMANGLGKAILPYLRPLISGLFYNCQMNEVNDLLLFMILMIHKFNSEITDVLIDLLPSLLTQVYIYLDKPVQGTDDLVALTDLRKTYLAFLASVLQANLQTVYTIESNAPHLPALIQSVCDLAQISGEPTVQKTAVTLLNRMNQVWLSPVEPPPHQVPGLNQFLMEKGTDAVMRSVLMPSFNLADAQTALLLHEIVNYLYSLTSILGPPYATFLEHQYLPILQVPASACQQLVSALQSLSAKEFRAPFKSFITSLRGNVGS